eukprot:6717974-Prymnesium_polylepis.1
MHDVPIRVFWPAVWRFVDWPAAWRFADCGLLCLPELGRRLALRVGLCVECGPSGACVCPVCTAPICMDPNGTAPGSGTNLNSLNSTPDASSRVHHTRKAGCHQWTRLPLCRYCGGSESSHRVQRSVQGGGGHERSSPIALSC